MRRSTEQLDDRVLISSSWSRCWQESLTLLGVKLAMANALLAELNVIPNVGPTLSTVFPCLWVFSMGLKAVAVLGLYVVIQNIESYVITPFYRAAPGESSSV